MLTALRIQSFAIIDELEVRFAPGFNVLTGETGAGKSILVEALHLILGGRARAEVIRTGADEAAVEALFEGVELWDRLAALGLPTSAGELLVRRVIHRSGKSRVWINGSVATVGLLERATRGLVDVSGQHEHVSLLDPEIHLALLDGWAGLHADVARYREAYDALSAKEGERRTLSTDDQERARRADYLSFQIEEIERVAPLPGEDVALQAERKKLVGAARLREAAQESERALYSGEGSAVESIGAGLGRLVEAASIDPALEPVCAALKAAQVEVEEVARHLTGYVRELDCDPSRLSEVDERLEAVRRLLRKHGGDVAAVLGRLSAMKEELAGLACHGERLAALSSEVEDLGSKALGLAEALSTGRRAAAARFAPTVEAELAGLAMAGTVFQVALEPREAEGARQGARDARLGPRGLDRCELLLAPNPGEAPRPLSRIASGGELSRVMLAVKRALARTDPVPTYVFDEVDSGVSGAVAEVVGRLLREVSRQRQVLAITHLPQIAACADHHYRVEKKMAGGRATSRVAVLVEAERRREVARMLAGVEVTEAAVRNAEAMIASATRRRRRG